MAKVELDRMAAGLRSARLPRLRKATGLTATVNYTVMMMWDVRAVFH